MPISVSEAADIARRHGLTLTDASALRNLAGSVDEAEALAEQFQALPPVPQSLGDAVAQAEAAGDSDQALRLKSQWLARLHQASGSQGRVPTVAAEVIRQGPVTPPEAAQLPDPPAAASPEPQTPVEDLRPGAMPTTHQPTMAEQIAAAETAGDFATAITLKGRQLADMHRLMNGLDTET